MSVMSDIVQPPDILLSPLQAAMLLGVSTRTITRWADDDDHPLTVAGTTAGGQRRFSLELVERIAAERAA